MSLFAIIIYETIYAVIYLGLLFSKSTLLLYCPNPSLFVRVLFLVILFSGFFVPYFLSLLRIRLTTAHYGYILAGCCLVYAVSSGYYYYSSELNERRFINYHSFLQLKPIEQNAEVPKPPELFRIICLGGSTTAGSYPAMLEKLLRGHYPIRKIEVINAGYPFYSSQHDIIHYLFYLQELDPDLIIFFEAINDLFTSFTMPPFSSKPFRKDYGHFCGAIGDVRYPTTFEKFLSRFFFADLLKPVMKPAPFSDFKSLTSFRRNIETLIEIAQSRRIGLILSNQAHCFSSANDGDIGFLGFPSYFLLDDKHYADEKSWYTGMELFNEAIRQAAEKYSLPFVDQATACRGKKNLFTDGVHLTIEGERLKAQIFLDKIVKLGLIKGDR